MSTEILSGPSDEDLSGRESNNPPKSIPETDSSDDEELDDADDVDVPLTQVLKRLHFVDIKKPNCSKNHWLKYFILRVIMLEIGRAHV